MNRGDAVMTEPDEALLWAKAPTNEQIIAEAKRRSIDSVMTLESLIIEVVREGWTPPEPVDPDVLAFREWAAKDWPITSEAALGGHMDTTNYAQAFLAGARMAREQERERAKVLLRGLENIVDADQDVISHMALDAMVKYTEGGR